jgi:hypothetical protein
MEDPLASTTFYTILVQWRDEVRPFTVESQLLQTEDEVITTLEENPNAIAVYRHDPDVPRQEVSEDIALRWLAQLYERHFDPGEDTLPRFIGNFLNDDQIRSGGSRRMSNAA